MGAGGTQLVASCTLSGQGDAGVKAVSSSAPVSLAGTPQGGLQGHKGQSYSQGPWPHG